MQLCYIFISMLPSSGVRMTFIPGAEGILPSKCLISPKQIGFIMYGLHYMPLISYEAVDGPLQ